MSRNDHEWFKFEFRPWLESRRVQRMSLAAQGLYVRVLCVQALQGNVPADPTLLAIEAKVSPAAMEHWKECLEHFKEGEGSESGFLYNEKLRKHLQDAKNKSEKLKANGSKGGRPKKNQKVNKKEPNGLPKVKPEASLRASYSNSNSYSNSLDDFNTFWEAYPPRRRTKKPLALEAWNKHVTSADLAKAIISHVQDRAAKDPEWLKNDGEFIPGPTPFLNQARWEDHYSTAHPTAQRPARFQTEGDRRNAEMQQHSHPKSRKLTPEEREAARREIEQEWQETDGDSPQ